MSETPKKLCRPMRYCLLGLGILCSIIGIAGIILPGLPGTVFLLIAIWSFTHSSERMHTWLYHHPRFGRTIREWHQHRVIPLRAKCIAIGMMAASFAGIAMFLDFSVLLQFAIGLILIGVICWMTRQPTQPPGSKTSIEKPSSQHVSY